MLVQSLGCPAQEAPSSEFSHSAPYTRTTISFEIPQEWCCQPISWRCLSSCPSYTHWNLLPKPFPAVWLPQSTAFLTLPAQDLFGSAHLSHVPASSLQLAVLSCCSPAPHVPQPRYPKLVQRPLHCKALQQDQIMFPAHSSSACALQHISDQASETFSCSPPQSVIPTSFPSPICLHHHRSASCLLQTESLHLPQIKWLAQLLSTCCTGNSQANDKCHTNTPRPGNQKHC